MRSQTGSASRRGRLGRLPFAFARTALRRALTRSDRTFVVTAALSGHHI